MDIPSMGFAVPCLPEDGVEKLQRSRRCALGTVTNKYQKEREKGPSDKQHNFFDDGSCIGRMIFVGCLMLVAVDGVEWER